MPEVLDWPSIADPQAVIRRAVAALQGGRLVALPTAASIILAASALSPPAVQQLAALRSPGSFSALSARGEPDLSVWAPQLSTVGRRLARRCWPGPVILTVNAAPATLAHLPEATRERVRGEAGLRLAMPEHDAVLDVLYQCAGPLVLAGIEGDASAVATRLGEQVEFILADGTPTGQTPTVVRLTEADWSLEQAGQVSAEALVRHTNCWIIFICTGNTCRSPMAEALCKKLLADKVGCAPDELPAHGFNVLSAGLAAMMGGAAATEAVAVVRNYGAELAHHISRPLSVELAAQADYLIGMTHGHVDIMREYYPQLGAEPRLLDSAGEDIADPVGCPLDVYERCARQIWHSLEALLADIRE